MTESSGYAVLDLEYVRRCRHSAPWQIVWNDLGILRRTVVVMAKGEGLTY